MNSKNDELYTKMMNCIQKWWIVYS